jgi:hypothetical protein
MPAEDHLMSCSFKSTFGLECFGCGTQRSFLALLRGDIVASFMFNPGVILLLITLIAFAVVYFKKPKWITRVITIGVLSSAIGMVGNFVFKLMA